MSRIGCGWIRAVFSSSATWLVLAACGGGDSADDDNRLASGVEQVSPIVWSTLSDAADGMVVTDDLIVVISPEVLTAFDRRRGTVTWSESMSDTSGPTPALITPDGVIVVAPMYEDVQAFDALTGRPVPVPPDVTIPALPPDRADLPAGYASDNGTLLYLGKPVWAGSPDDLPFVGRVGELTVINDFTAGVVVVDDRGTVLAAPELGGRQYDESPVLVDGDAAVTVASDGMLYLISPNVTDG